MMHVIVWEALLVFQDGGRDLVNAPGGGRYTDERLKDKKKWKAVELQSACFQG